MSIVLKALIYHREAECYVEILNFMNTNKVLDWTVRSDLSRTV